jgi:hypothetical protein
MMQRLKPFDRLPWFFFRTGREADSYVAKKLGKPDVARMRFHDYVCWAREESQRMFRLSVMQPAALAQRDCLLWVVRCHSRDVRADCI